MFEAVTKSGDTLIVHNTLPPVGTVMWLSGNTVPNGCLVADGAAVSRTTYAELFASIGTTWGEGDGSTTFGLPDMRNRFPEGAQTAGGYNAPGLPNIVAGIITTQDWGGLETQMTGAWVEISHEKRGTNVSVGDTADEFIFTFNASHSNSIYGQSSTVQPASVKLLPVIVYRT